MHICGKTMQVTSNNIASYEDFSHCNVGANMGSARFEELFCKDWGVNAFEEWNFAKHQCMPKVPLSYSHTDHRMLRHPTHYERAGERT